MTTTDHLRTATIEADPEVPLIRITRDFHAAPAQVHRAHTDPELYARWVGPTELATRIEHWDARTGGAWAFVNIGPDGEEYAFHGSFHDVTPDRIVQTFSFDAWPEGVSLETLRLEDLGDGWTRLRTTSLFDSFESRGQMLESDMEVGVNEGYAALDALLADGAVPADGAAAVGGSAAAGGAAAVGGSAAADGAAAVGGAVPAHGAAAADGAATAEGDGR